MKRKLVAAGQIRERDLGTGPEVAAGDRCRDFGKRQGFPLQNPFKQTEREPDPREGVRPPGTPEGPPEKPVARGTGKEMGQQDLEGGWVLREQGRQLEDSHTASTGSVLPCSKLHPEGLRNALW